MNELILEMMIKPNAGNSLIPWNTGARKKQIPNEFIPQYEHGKS